MADSVAQKKNRRYLERERRGIYGAVCGLASNGIEYIFLRLENKRLEES